MCVCEYACLTFVCVFVCVCVCVSSAGLCLQAGCVSVLCMSAGRVCRGLAVCLQAVCVCMSWCVCVGLGGCVYVVGAVCGSWLVGTPHWGYRRKRLL